MNADSFSEGNEDRVYTDVNCVGNESRLVDCSLTMFSGTSCTTVGVVCQCKFQRYCILYFSSICQLCD